MYPAGIIGKCGLVWLHINFHNLFNVKTTLVEKQQWYYLTHSWRKKGLAWLDFMAYQPL